MAAGLQGARHLEERTSATGRASAALGCRGGTAPVAQQQLQPGRVCRQLAPLQARRRPQPGVSPEWVVDR